MNSSLQSFNLGFLHGMANTMFNSLCSLGGWFNSGCGCFGGFRSIWSFPMAGGYTSFNIYPQTPSVFSTPPVTMSVQQIQMPIMPMQGIYSNNSLFNPQNSLNSGFDTFNMQSPMYISNTLQNTSTVTGLYSSNTTTPINTSTYRSASTSLTPVTKTRNSNPLKNENKYDDLINKYAKQYNIEPEFVKAVIKQESKFNPNAGSNKGAKGLMQLMPSTAKSYGVTDVYDPEQNIRAGTEMLSRLSKQYNGDKEMILAAYNWGSGNLAKKGFEKRPKETQKYIPLVLGYYNEYKAARTA